MSLLRDARDMPHRSKRSLHLLTRIARANKNPARSSARARIVSFNFRSQTI
jgi:hypothetical protein